MPGSSPEPFLAGRDGELSVLRDGLDRARSGRARLILVEGPGGIGKSALLTRFVDSECAGAQVIWVRCDRFEQDLAYAAAELVLGEPIDGSCSELEVGRRLLARLGDGRSGRDVTVLAVDDAHWMDAPSARALRFALRRLRVEPILAVVTRRPGSADASVLTTEDASATVVLRPVPLSPGEVLELARRLRGWRLGTDTVARLHQQTGGNPLLLTSVLRSADDRSRVETWTDIPASAADAVAQTLQALDPAGRAVVEAAAVLDEPTDAVVLGAVGGIGDVSSGMAAASAAGLLTSDPAGGVRMSHALLRDAIYDSLPLDRRRVLHSRAAAWTSGDRRLGHRTAALTRPDPVLVAELTEAADRAREARRYDLGAAHRLRARSISADPVERDALLLEAVIDRVWAQDLAGAEDLATTLESMGPSALRSLALGLIARERGRVGEAVTHLEEALTWPVESAEQIVRERAAVAAAWLYVRLGDASSAAAALDAVPDIADPESAGDAVTLRGVVLWQSGRHRDALSQLEHIALSREGQPWEAELVSTRGTLNLYGGALEQAADDMDQTIAMSHLWRPSANQTVMYALRCLVRQYRGDWDGALSDAAAARAVADQAEAWSVVWARAVSIWVPAARGQWEIAADHLAAARAKLAALPYAQVEALVGRAECAIHVARDDHLGLRAAVRPLVSDRKLEETAIFRSYRWILPAWIRSGIALGQLVEAEEQLERYVGLLDRWPGGPDPARVGWLRGLLALARGRVGVARGHFAADLADPATTADPFVQAQLRQAWGRLEHAAGRRREAVRHLVAAYDLFVQLRATPFVERCRQDLAACGVASMSADPRVLTERQEDVVALVARGYTNKEVARELFISAKAVEYHLRGIYAKLGVTGRRELLRLRTPPASVGLPDVPWSETSGRPGG